MMVEGASSRIHHQNQQSLENVISPPTEGQWAKVFHAKVTVVAMGRVMINLMCFFCQAQNKVLALDC